jgi:phosphopantothenoylcysteine decarboxylase/phosphopantothenate--cysteine ligase
LKGVAGVSSLHITLYITGGIAAYKAASLVRLWKKSGHMVRVVMTESATKFITPLTLATLSQEEVVTDNFAEPQPGEVSHIALADWTNVAVAYPATANFIAEIANGLAGNMASTTWLATTAPKIVFPAMNGHMLNQSATQRNIVQLATDGVTVAPTDTGFLAEGYKGEGRLLSPETAQEFVTYVLSRGQGVLQDAQVVITAGGTKEAIDPVRELTNRSSGKMGYALAVAALAAGANVTLISTTGQLPAFGINYIPVADAREMQQALTDHFDTNDIVIMAAAVADWRPQTVAQEKLKKQPGQETWHLDLVRNPDILAHLGTIKTHQFLVGFAAETQDLLANATKKLSSKRADMLVANNVGGDGVGFGADNNAVTVLQPDAAPISLSKAPKTEIAVQLINIIGRAQSAQQ